MKDVLLDVALKELINTISCQWLKIIQIEITEKKNNLQKQEDIWHIQEMVYTPIKTSGQEFKNRVRTCSRGEEECRGLPEWPPADNWQGNGDLSPAMQETKFCQQSE